MLAAYSVYESWRAGTTAWLNASKAISQSALGRSSSNHTVDPYSAAAEVALGFVQQRVKPSWDLNEVENDGERVGIAQQTVKDLPFCRLLRFLPVDRTPPKKKLLLVAPMSGHHATLLRKTVRRLLPTHDVYVTDWVDGKMVPAAHGPFGIDEYIDYVINFLRSFDERVHVMAVCQPAPLVLAAVALMSKMDDPLVPKSMTLMGGPIDPSANPTSVTEFADRTPLAMIEQLFISQVPTIYPGSGRTVYPGHIQLQAFMSMNPERHGEAMTEYFQNMMRGDTSAVDRHRTFYDEYLTVMDTPSEFYLQTVDRIFQRKLLPNGAFNWRGQRVDCAAITKTALLTVEGGRDDISAPGQTFVAHALCASLDAELKHHHLEEDAGHYGIFSGRRWRENVATKVEAFIDLVD